MKILVRNPNSDKKFNPLAGGTKSFIAFRNERFWTAMNEMFKTRNGEQIVGLELTDEGIKATFEPCTK